jgi:tape measure domain-containing protein
VAVGGLTFVGVARGAIEAADAITTLRSKLRLVTEGEDELANTQQRVLDLARQTRTDFGSIGELYARIARSSKTLGVSQGDVLRVTKAVSQAIQISGNTAQEASAGMIQLAQALASGVLRGDELRSVLEQMPRVAEAIATGLGTTIGKLRQLGQEGKLTSDLVFKALISQTGALDSEFKRLQPTVTQTFTVLLNELKVATAGLLSATGTTDRLTRSVELLSSALRGVSSFFTVTTGYVNTFTESMEKSDRALLKFLHIDYDKFNKLQRQFLLLNPLTGPLLALLSEEPKVRTRGPTGAQRGRGRQADALLPAKSDLEEINVTVRKITDENGDALRDLEAETRTSVERVSADYSRLKAALQTLLDEGKITKAKFDERLSAAQDEMLPEFDLNEIKAKYITLKHSTTELGEFMKGVWREVGRSIQSTLSDAIYEWHLSWKSLLNIARRALADITSAIITSGIKNALKSQLSSSSSSSSSSTTGSILAGLGKLFGLAGGGQYDGLRMVGEDGPELVSGRGRVWNQRQMAFAGMGGAKITFAPVNNFNIIERENPDQTKRELVQYYETRSAQQQQEFVHLLQRSGVEVKG